MRLKYEKVIHHAIVNNLFGLESMKKSCNTQGSSKYYLFVTASFVALLWINPMIGEKIHAAIIVPSLKAKPH